MGALPALAEPGLSAPQRTRRLRSPLATGVWVHPRPIVVIGDAGQLEDRVEQAIFGEIDDRTGHQPDHTPGDLHHPTGHTLAGRHSPAASIKFSNQKIPSPLRANPAECKRK